jgi:hypothetical protein
MIKVSLCYSRKEGPEFASCSINDVELDAALLDKPEVFAAAVKTAYTRCVEAVDTQLVGEAPSSPAPPVNPAIVRANQPPPAPAAPPAPMPPAVPPPTNGTTYYGNSQPPKTGKQLGGWAKTNGCLAWFRSFGAAQKPSPLPELCSAWSNEWAVYAYTQYMAAQQTPNAPPPVTTNGAPY